MDSNAWELSYLDLAYNKFYSKAQRPLATACLLLSGGWFLN